MLAAAVDIVKDDGPGALLSGLGPTVVGYGIEGAMKVSHVYEDSTVWSIDKLRHVSLMYANTISSLACMRLPSLYFLRF